jgi:uncharacterized protein YbcV (DUF1398 family)
MNEPLTATAQRCLQASFDGTMDFPAIVQALVEAGVEGYDVDFRRGTTTSFRATGESVQLDMPSSSTTVAATFDAGAVEQAVREARRQAPGYTYAGFCARVKAAGCAGYRVSFLGRRVSYFGRTAEIHVEHFPRVR